MIISVDHEDGVCLLQSAHFLYLVSLLSYTAGAWSSTTVKVNRVYDNH